MKRVVVLLLLCLLSPVSSFAQQFWLQTAGPGVGTVTAFGKGANGVILAASGESGIFYSTNKGTDWTASSKTIEYSTKDVFATNSKGWIFTITGDEVFVSKNNGQDWSTTAGSPSDAGASSTLRTITIDNDDVLYIGTDNADSKGIWISNDDGDSWGAVATGLPKLPAIGGYYSVGGMAAGPDGSIYICSGGGVHRLASGSTTWTLAGFGGQVDIPGKLDTVVYSIAVSSTGRIFAVVSSIGLCASSDKGKTWARLANKGGLNTTLGESVAADDNVGIIYSAGLDGVYISTDNGVSWKISRQPSDDPAQAVAFAGAAAAAYIGYKNSGVAFSDTKGATWIPHNKGLFNSHINAMCADNKGNVFTSVQLSSMYSTNNAGDVWSNVSEALASKDIRGLGATSSNALFAATYKTADETDNGGLLTSNDGGANWTQVNLTGTYAPFLTALTTNGAGSVFVGGDNGIVFISIDNGATWLNKAKPIRSGITQSPITALTWVEPDHLFAANKDGIFRSAAISDTTKWEPLATSPKDVTAMVADLVSNPHIIYASAADGIYSSNDDGSTWVKNGAVTSAAGIAINSKGVIYAIGGNGTFSSNDKGANWKHESDELNSLSPTLLFVDHKDVLYAGTAANGVYRNPLFPTDASVFASHKSASISFENNYPNPFFATTNIRYLLTKASLIQLEVFDMNGKYVTTLANEFQLEGQHTVAFDAATYSIPGGIYNCRLSSNGESVMTSIVYLGK